MDMTWFLWVAGLFLLAVVGLAMWKNFRSPAFVAGFIAVIMQSFYKYLLPKILKRKSPEEEAIDREFYRRGEKRPTKFNRHPGEGGNSH